jgi:nitroimidazol reductase NimA-like FMN-containing flavoprotein (pyridoxamine 5'-phosphate oxidase superfamily)
MPSRREQISMAPDEVRTYLEEQQRIIVVTNGANGLPHAVPMNYGLDDQGRILIMTFRKSQKVKNLERDPRWSDFPPQAVMQTAVWLRVPHLRP